MVCFIFFIFILSLKLFIFLCSNLKNIKKEKKRKKSEVINIYLKLLDIFLYIYLIELKNTIFTLG